MTKRAVAVIIAGFLTVFIAFSIRYAYGMLLPKMLVSLAISKTQAGLIFSSYFVAYTLCAPLLGSLADRYDVRVILTLFVALLGTGAFLMSYATSVLNASLFFLVAGIGHSACWAPVAAVIQRWVSDKRRGIALAFADVGSATGIIVWSAVLPIMVASRSWRTGWVSLGVVALVVAVLNYWLVRSRPPEEQGPQPKVESIYSKEPIGVTYRRLFKDINFWLLGLSYLLVAFTILVPYTFISSYAVEGLAMPYETATKLIAVIGISGIAGKLFLSSLSDTLGRVRIMMLCSACLAVGSLGIAYSSGFFLLILFLVIVGLGYGALWPVYAAAARDFFSEKSAGSVIGLWTVYLGVGSITSPILAGWTIDKTGHYTSAFLLAMAGAILSILLLLPIAKTKAGTQG